MLERPSRMCSCSGDREPRTGHSQNRAKTAAKLLPETGALSLQSSLHKPKPTQEEAPPGRSTREAKESCACPGEQHFPRNAAVPNPSATKQIKMLPECKALIVLIAVIMAARLWFPIMGE